MAYRPAFLLLAAAAIVAIAQAPKSFDVATIKPNAASDNRIMIGIRPGGAFVATGITLRILIAQAYNVRDFQIQGGPGWLSTERFDVNAKAEGLPDRVPPEVFQPLLQGLLEERFKLKVHKESKEMPVYVLLAGKGPHKLKASEPSPGGGGENRGMIRIGRGQANLNGTTMAGFARMLSQQLGRPVLDKTNISGNFDVELRWTPEPGHGGGLFGGPPPPDAIAPSDTSGPSIFTAIQEQLGLKLDTAKGPVDIIVIDSVEKPTEN